MTLALPASAGVIGWPVAQSKSPLIHRFWLEALAIDGDYGRFPVAPERLAGAVGALPALGLRGVNVTVPHKVAVIDLLDRIDPVAAMVGAVNTVVVEPSGALRGANTDVAGFMEPLAGRVLAGRAATVLGAGGAARAVLAGLRDAGIAEVTIVARDAGAAAALLARFGLAGRVQGFDQPLPAETALLVNATSLGMVGKDPLVVDLGPLGPDTVVYDLVYAPLETGLLAAARRRELPAIDGLSMLIGQAAPAFAAFFGATPPRHRDAELRALLVGAA
jgi:shikimate dehydrogenase